MHKYLFRPLLVLLCCGLFWSCEIINPAEDQPAFVRIEAPVFYARPEFGTDSVPGTYEIPSGWVYYSGKLLGVFDLPVELPILNTGPTRIFVEPGVIADGQRATRTHYELYTRYDSTLNIIPGQSYTVKPKYQYRPTVQKKLNLTFEGNFGSQGEFAVNDPYSIDFVVNTPSDPLYFPGGQTAFGIIRAKPDTTTFIRLVSVPDPMSLLQQGRPVYAEFNLNANTIVEVGLEATRNGEVNFYSELLILPTNGWKKFYVNLVNEANVVQDNTTSYKLVLLADPRGSGTEYIAIDNIRLIQIP